MRIVIISNLFAPYARGGAEELMRDIADFLHAEKHEIHVVTLDPEYDKTFKNACKSFDTSAPYPIHRIRHYHAYDILDDTRQSYISKIKWHLKDLSNPKTEMKIRDVVEYVNPGRIIVGNTQGMSRRIPALLADFETRHIIHDIQMLDPSGLVYSEKQLNRLQNRIYKLITERMVHETNENKKSKWFCTAPYIADLLQKAYPMEITTLPNPKPIFEPIQKQYAESPTVLFIGQLSEHKGLSEFISCAKRFPNIDFEIAGAGPLEQYVYNRAAQFRNIRYLGYVSGSDKINAFARADLVWTRSDIIDLYPERWAWTLNTRTLGGQLNGMKSHANVFDEKTEFNAAIPGWTIMSDKALHAFFERFESNIDAIRSTPFEMPAECDISMRDYIQTILE